MVKVVLGYEKDFQNGYVYEVLCKDIEENQIIEKIRWDFFIPDYQDRLLGKEGFICTINGEYVLPVDKQGARVPLTDKRDALNGFVFKGEDARRAIGYLYAYGKCISSIKISERKDGEEKKSWNYEEIQFQTSYGNNLYFESKLCYREGGKNVYWGKGKFAIPINITYFRSTISPLTTEAFYVLSFWGQDASGCPISCELTRMKGPRERDDGLDIIDLFYGRIACGETLCQGLFFCSQRDLGKGKVFGEFYPKYVIETSKEGDSFKYTDVRKSLKQQALSVVELQGDSNAYEHLLGSVSEENAEAFQRKFVDEIVVPGILPTEGKLEGISYSKKGTKCEFILHVQDKIFRYYVPVRIIEHEDTDYYFAEDGYGTLGYSLEAEKEIWCELTTDVHEWMVSYSGEEKRKRSFKSFLTYLSGTDIPDERRYVGNSVKELYEFLEVHYKDLFQLFRVYDEILLGVIKVLYPDGYVPDETIVKQIYEAKLAYEKSGKSEIPNFAIMGPPGIGKTKLVKNIADYLCDKTVGVMVNSPSSLKGTHVGQTAMRVYDLLTEAAEKDKIVFIDEAYHLQADAYGKEATEILLPLLSGDKKEIEAYYNNKTYKHSFERNDQRVPAIWFAGYEHEMRKMLSENQGLYRRMIKLSLSAPSVNSLYERLCYLAEADADVCAQVYKQCKGEIKNYFGWGCSQENVTYFANYSGVEEFHKTCSLRINADMSDEKKRKILLSVIDEKKSEIRKQYMAVLMEVRNPLFKVETDIEVNFDSVKGNDAVVESLQEIVHMLTHRREYTSYGISVPKGALLIGPPGTGKTFLARATAGEVQQIYQRLQDKDHRVAFVAVSATELMGEVDVSADSKSGKKIGKVKTLFREVEEYDTCILFIDEIDAIGKNRNLSEAHVNELIQLMTEMDGFQERSNLFVMAATNVPDSLDPALKRPGRFDRTLEVTLPDKEGRAEILKLYLEKLTFLKDCSKKEMDAFCDEIASETRNYSPPKLKNAVNEAALLFKHSESCRTDKSVEDNCSYRVTSYRSAHTYLYWLKEGKIPVLERFKLDFLETLERLNVGKTRKYRREEAFQCEVNQGCSATAIHEVGHALVGALLGIIAYDKISTIPRGDVLGYACANKEVEPRTKREFLNYIQIALGGRVAEELFYGEDISIEASKDIKQATKYAKDMVMAYGMTDEIGPVSLLDYANGYLGEDGSYQCSDAFRKEADAAVSKLLNEQLELTRNLLKVHKDTIRELAIHIFQAETLTGEAFMTKYKEICNKATNELNEEGFRI